MAWLHCYTILRGRLTRVGPRVARTWLRYARYNQGRNVCFNVWFNNNNNNNGHFYSAGISPTWVERTLIYKISKKCIQQKTSKIKCIVRTLGDDQTNYPATVEYSLLIAHCSRQSRERPKTDQPATVDCSLLTAHRSLPDRTKAMIVEEKKKHSPSHC